VPEVLDQVPALPRAVTAEMEFPILELFTQRVVAEELLMVQRQQLAEAVTPVA